LKQKNQIPQVEGAKSSKRLVDLHVHSTYSDGSLSPELLMRKGEEQALEMMTISDHDTISGLKSIWNKRENWSFDLISGVEISTSWENKELHILGFNFDVQNDNLNQFLSEQGQLRAERAKLLFNKLQQKLKIVDVEKKIKEMTTSDIICRSHIAQLLVNEGKAVDTRRAFEKFLHKGKSLHVKSDWPNLSKVVATINQANGIAVIAHPSRYRLSNSNLCQLIHDFSQHGGKGIELSYPGIKPKQQKQLARMAKENGLWASQGTDFHHEFQHWANIRKVLPIPADMKPVWDYF